VLTQQSTLRSFHPLWNTSTQNKDGIYQFSPTRATNRLPQQSLLSKPSQSESFVMKPTYTSILPESLAKINPDTLVEKSETCVFWPRMYPPTMHKISGIIEVHKNFYCCGMPAHRIKTGSVIFPQHTPQIGYHRHAPWASRHNWNLLPWSRLTHYICGKFSEDQSRHSGVNNTNVHIFCMCASTHLCKWAARSQTQGLLDQSSRNFYKM